MKSGSQVGVNEEDQRGLKEEEVLEFQGPEKKDWKEELIKVLKKGQKDH